MIGGGLSFPLSAALSSGNNAVSGGVTYEAEATALFARFSVDPGTTRKNAINTCIASLKTAGVWAKLDALWVFAAPNRTDAKLNWVSTSHTMTEVGGVATFAADQGFTGGAGYLETPTNISTYTLYQQNSAHLGIWVRSTAADGNPIIKNSTANISIYPRISGGGDEIYTRINDSAGPVGTAASAAGFVLGNRSGATSREAYKNGVSLGSFGSVSSSAVPAEPLNPIIGSSGQLSVCCIGSSLNSTEQGNLYTALNTLQAAVGW